MNPVFRWIWIVCMLIIEFLDLITSYWSEVAGGDEANALMNWLVESFGPAVAIFVFGSILKIGFMIFLFFSFEFCFKLAKTIPEKPARIFSQFAIYFALVLFPLFFIPVIARNYLTFLYYTS